MILPNGSYNQFFLVDANDIFKRMTSTCGGCKNALLSEKWSENPQVPPEIEPGTPEYKSVTPLRSPTTNYERDMVVTEYLT